MAISDALDIQLSRLRVRYAKTPLPRFFAWWKGELVGMLPERWRTLVAERAEELLIEAQPGQFVIWRQSGARCAEFGRLSREMPAEEARSEFARLRGLIDDPQLRIYYCVPAARCLRRDLTLPAAAEDKLRQVLTFEMDRQTPFKAEQVYFDYRIAARDAAAKSLAVNLTVVPRAQLDPELAALANFGIALDGVDCWQGAQGGERAGLNLLPVERRVKRKNQRLRLNFALAGAASLLLFIAMWQSLANREASVAAMTAEVEKAQNDAKQTAALAKKLEERAASANFLFHLKSDTTTMTELLADLTQRLPDDTFLERLTVDDRGKVDVQGQSNNAARLIDGLQKSEVLTNPGFAGTIQSDPRTHKERFNLSFELRHGPRAAEHKDNKAPADKAGAKAEAAHAPAA
ncbi:MAG: PilN domain-containing protein [Gammaproteobacteria bacterium]|nr:MAG: PilN domain-containing protein [Gammaproteobacteria bacterium]